MANNARRQERLERQARQRRGAQWARVGAFGAIVVVVLAAIIYLLAPVFETKASGIVQIGNTKIVNLQAGMDGFDLKEIHVKAGEQVKVNLRSMDNSLHNDGGGQHQFAIDELGVNIVAQPLSLNSGTFTPTRPGTYTFYCDICCGGRANPTMNGKLVVEA